MLFLSPEWGSGAVHSDRVVAAVGRVGRVVVAMMMRIVTWVGRVVQRVPSFLLAFLAGLLGRPWRREKSNHDHNPNRSPPHATWHDAMRTVASHREPIRMLGRDISNLKLHGI